MKQATFPAIIALITTLARGLRWFGAIVFNPPNITPMEPKFAKPHKAYVAMISERFWKTYAFVNCSSLVYSEGTTLDGITRL